MSTEITITDGGTTGQPLLTVRLHPQQLPAGEPESVAKLREGFRAKLAEVVGSEPFTRVAQLHQRRADAEATIHATTRQIAQLKADFTETIAQGGDGQKIIKQIGDAETKISQAKMTLDAIDAALPEAERARYLAAKAAAREAATAISAEINATRQQAESDIMQAVPGPIATYLALDRLRDTMSRLSNADAQQLLSFVGQPIS